MCRRLAMAGAVGIALVVLLFIMLIVEVASFITGASSAGTGSAGANTPVVTAAEQIASHLHCQTLAAPCSAANHDNFYDVGIPQKALSYWEQSCPFHSGCYSDWQNGSLQCVMLVTGAFALAGTPLPVAGNAIDFWQLYANRSGWVEISSSAPGATVASRGLPQPGDIMVWSHVPFGHVAIVTAVVPPGKSQPGSVTFVEANGPGAILTEPLLPDLTVQTWNDGYTVLGYIRSTTIIPTTGLDASARLVRISQLDPAQYGPPASEYGTWAYSACSAASMTEVLNAYGHNYRIHDILTVEAQRGDITPDLGLVGEDKIADTVAQFGFVTTWGHTLTLDAIISAAKAGTPVIVSFPPDVYAGGHLLVVRGGDANNVLVADSSGWNHTSISRAQFTSWWIGHGQTLGFSAIVTPKGRAQLPLSKYVALAQQDATAAGIDPQIFVHQINTESGFDPNASSLAGAEGIAQFMPSTAADMRINPWDPVASLKAAAILMSGYVRSYGGDYAMALAAYNAGAGAVQSALATCGVALWRNCLPLETQNYIHTILGS